MDNGFIFKKISDSVKMCVSVVVLRKVALNGYSSVQEWPSQSNRPKFNWICSKI